MTIPSVTNPLVFANNPGLCKISNASGIVL